MRISQIHPGPSAADVFLIALFDDECPKHLFALSLRRVLGLDIALEGSTYKRGKKRKKVKDAVQASEQAA